MKQERALFLDRDGVINKNRVDNVRSWDQFEFEEGALEALALAGESDFRIVVITNQSGIGRGHMTEDTVLQIHARMVQEVVQTGGRVDKVYYCPHTPEDNCTCRKPAPEMLLRGRDCYNLDVTRSYFVGDWVDDVLAARNAGVTPLLVRTGRGERAIQEMLEKNIPLPEIAENLMAAIRAILAQQSTSQAIQETDQTET